MIRKENQATTRNSFFFTLFMLLAALIAVGCRSEKSDNESTSDAMKTAVSTKQMKLDACEVLGAIGIDEVLGEAIGEAQPQVQIEAKGRAVSQCRYETESGKKSVGLLLRYSAVEKNPKTITEFVDSQVSTDFMGLGEETAAALKQGREIAGVGDLAFFYEMFGKNLIVFWNEHYQMTVMIDGFADEAETVDRAKTVAQRVLKELSN